MGRGESCMSTPLDVTGKEVNYVRMKSTKPKKHTYKLLFGTWALLIAFGAMGSKLYTDHLKNAVTAEIAKQTEVQLKQVQDDYKKQLGNLKDSLTSDIAKLQAKIDTLNELLAFTKDSANTKTDNSNQLYTQLAELKKKLDELQKNLDVLK